VDSWVRAAAPLLFAAALACAGPGPPEAAPLAAANNLATGRSVILIVLDTLRLDHMSLYGYDRATTPFLEELGRESLVFDRAYAPASWTRASTASLLTSRLPESHGCEGRDGRLAPEVETLAEVLSAEGYDTLALVANGNVAPHWGFRQGFDQYQYVRGPSRLPYADAAAMDPFVRRATATLTESPFFLYLHYVDPHDPYYVHPGFDYTDPAYEGPIDGSFETLKPFNRTRPTDADVAHVEALYDGEIAWLDDQLRGLVAHLAEIGMLDRAWLVVTSDHGEGLWRHRTRSHGYELYEEQLRVPLMIRPPGGLRAERRLADPVSLIDVAPTLLELVGLSPSPPGFEGRSWAAFLHGTGVAPLRPIVVDEELDALRLGAVIDGDDKLIANFRGRAFELCDLASDPEERHTKRARNLNVLAKKARRLQRVLRTAIARAGRNRPADGTTTQSEEIDEDLRRQLEALGYMGIAGDE
jgi:arylsulfatase A-like enzyme